MNFLYKFNGVFDSEEREKKGDGNMKGAIRYEHRRGKRTGRLWTAS